MMDFQNPLVVSPQIAEAARSARTETEVRAERCDRRERELRRARLDREAMATSEGGKDRS